MSADVDELAGVVDAARQATAALEDPDLQKLAFERVLDHLLRNGGAGTRAPQAPTNIAPGAPVADRSADADGVLADEQQRVDAIARYFKIDPDQVEHIFDASGEDPRLGVHTGRLEGRKAQATRQIALLMAGARTALGQETTTTHIRDVADARNKLDSSNFMKTLGEMREISVLGKHGSPNRVVRMKVSGAEQAQQLAHQLLDE